MTPMPMKAPAEVLREELEKAEEEGEEEFDEDSFQQSEILNDLNQPENKDPLQKDKN